MAKSKPELLNERLGNSLVLGVELWPRREAGSRMRHCLEYCCNGYPPLLDLRFADDILIFSDSAERVASLLDALITTLDKTGLKLNASKTVILTTETQPPDYITTPAGHTIVAKDNIGTHKWLGCKMVGLHVLSNWLWEW